MFLIMMGVQGSGKGTQAAEIKDSLNIPHVTSGGLFRAMKNQDTPLARKVQEIMAAGDLVPDDITIEIVKDRITQDDAKNGFILDGFPRTRPQAEALSALMADLGQQISAVVFLNISDDEAVARISGRLQCRLDDNHIYHSKYNPPKESGVCDLDGGELFTRPDDQPESVLKRIGDFHAKTKPLLDYYREQGVLLEVSAEKAIDDVTKDVLAVLKDLK